MVFGKIDGNVSEVGLGANASPMIEWDESLPLIKTLLLQEATDLIVVASVNLNAH